MCEIISVRARARAIALAGEDGGEADGCREDADRDREQGHLVGGHTGIVRAESACASAVLSLAGQS